MIVHQYVTQDAHRQTPGTDAKRWSGVCHELQEGGKVAILMEHVGQSIPRLST